MTIDYTPAELTVTLASRLLKDGQIVFAGAGLPLLSAVHAQNLHAPTLAIMFEVGGVAPQIKVGALPRSANEARSVRRSVATPPTIDMLLYLQRGMVDVGFLGGAQVDQYGNLNSSLVGTFEKPIVRLPGSGGANDIASSANAVYIVMYHEKKRFVEKVDFLTSPGYLKGGRSFEESGLVGGGVQKVITNLGILDFEPQSRRMRLAALHPGVTVEEVRAKTGFELLVAKDLESTLPPTGEELKLLRALDPERKFLKAGEF
ncbi:MAG: 3-oxoadipate--succinyl-CoA transferase subunit B [Betaproteobacteria bacterium]|nr:3-oxoadipate--succinyl-CoA transferase subunit B [Betaproteobacteria bacterium]MBI2958769.1 3-oxoadipate--succinyl-CoA transferase subunit B [Betaproteobacteria bacterium]